MAADKGIRVDKTIPFPDKPHIALAGRSNVGKSTLLNTLLGFKAARTSKAPGRTRAIFCYEHTLDYHGEKQDFILTDLPGFGYAKVGRDLRKLWQGWTHDYFANNSPVQATALCIDTKIPPQDVDIDFLSWLSEVGHHRVILVGTKADRFNQKQRHKAQQTLDLYRKEFANLHISTVLVSALKKPALNELKAQLYMALKGA